MPRPPRTRSLAGLYYCHSTHKSMCSAFICHESPSSLDCVIFLDRFNGAVTETGVSYYNGETAAQERSLGAVQVQRPFPTVCDDIDYATRLTTPSRLLPARGTYTVPGYPQSVTATIGILQRSEQLPSTAVPCSYACT